MLYQFWIGLFGMIGPTLAVLCLLNPCINYSILVEDLSQIWSQVYNQYRIIDYGDDKFAAGLRPG